MLAFDGQRIIVSRGRAFLCFRCEKLCVANKNLRFFFFVYNATQCCQLAVQVWVDVCLCIHSFFLLALYHNDGILYVKCHSKIIQQVILDDWTREVKPHAYSLLTAEVWCYVNDSTSWPVTTSSKQVRAIRLECAKTTQVNILRVNRKEWDREK